MSDELLAQLAAHPAWDALRDRAKDRMEKQGRFLAQEFLTANRQPDYADLQYTRGFFAGMKFLIDQPTLEAKALAKALAEERGEQ